MSAIFYALGLVFFLYELAVLSSPKRIHGFVKGIRERHKKDESTPQDYIFTLFQMSYLCWALIGLLSDQWAGFVLLFILSAVPSRVHIAIWVVDAFLSASLVLFLIQNHFHLKMNLWDLATGLCQ